MASLVSELEKEGFVLPDFKNSNIEVSKQISSSDKGAFIGKNSKKIHIIIDGLGYNNFNSVISKHKELSKSIKDLKIQKITTTFPSTTMNVISSLYSGLTTAEHGVVGTNLFVKEAGLLINSIYLTSAIDPSGPKLGIDPKTIYPKGRMIDDVKSRHKKIKVLEAANIVKSTMSSALFDKEDLVPYITFEDMLVKIIKIIKSGEIDYIFAYYDLLDQIEHLYNPTSTETEQIIYTFISSLGRLLVPQLKEHGYDLIVTSDHGHVKVTNEEDNGFDYSHPINKYLEFPPWGESRAMFMQVKDKHLKEFEDHFNRSFGKIGKLIETEEAIKAGLFGSKSVKETFRYRFGTHILIPRGNMCLAYTFPGWLKKPFESKGRHGGLHSDEMLVPLLTYS